MLDANNTFDYMKKLMHSDKYSFIFTSFVYAFIISTLASRFVAIIDWLIFGIYKSNFEQIHYAMLRSKMPLQRFDPIVTVFVFLIALIFWYKFEFKKTKRAQ